MEAILIGAATNNPSICLIPETTVDFVRLNSLRTNYNDLEDTDKIDWSTDSHSVLTPNNRKNTMLSNICIRIPLIRSPKKKSSKPSDDEN